jgi:signal transduction histidine kinase
VEFIAFSFFVIGIVLAVAIKSAQLARVNIQIENEGKVKLGSVAARVAHDLGSPLTVLELVLRNVKSFPPEEKMVIEGAINRINSTTRELLQMAKSGGSAKLQFVGQEVSSPAEVIQQIVDEKKIEYSKLNNVALSFWVDQKSKGVKVGLSAIDLQRIISNLINNSVQARIEDRKLEVRTQIEKNQKSLLLTVADTGKGIPDHIKSRLGNDQLSFGKSEGTGLGLLTAFEKVRAAGGHLEVLSKVNVGTQIRISIPIFAEIQA